MSISNFNYKIGLLTLVIIVIAAIMVLIEQYYDLAKKDEKHLLAIAKNQLSDEMSNFVKRLDPIGLIEIATKDLETHLNLAIQVNQERNLIPMPDNKGLIFSKDFISFSLKFFKEKYGIEPFLIILKDAEKMSVHSKYDLFSELGDTTGENNKKEFAEAICQKLAVEHYSAHEVTSIHFNQTLSLFANLPSYPSKADFFYSLKFGNQRSFHIFNKFDYGYNSKTNPSIYYFCFNESDMNLKAFLENATTNSTDFIDREIVKISNKELKSFPRFTLEADKFVLYNDFPVTFFTSLRNMRPFNKELSTLVLQKTENSCLKISLDKKVLVSKYRKHIRYLQFLIYASILSFLFLYTTLRMKISLYSLKLFQKFKLTIAFLVLIPVIGFVIVTDIINNESYSIDVHNCQSEIDSHLNLLNEVFTNNDIRLMTAAQSLKKRITDGYFHHFMKTFPKHINQALSWKEFEFIDNIRFLTHDMRFCGLMKRFLLNGVTTTVASINPLDMLGYYRIIREMDLIKQGNTEAEVTIAKYDLALGGSASFWDNVTNRRRLALESYIDKPFADLDTVKRGMFQLFASAMEPNKPKIIAAYRINDRKLNTIILQQIIEKESNLFYSLNTNQHIQCGVFFCDPYFFFPNTMKHLSGSDKAYKVAHMAFKNRSTFNSTLNTENGTLIQSAIYKGGSSIILAAEGFVSKSGLNVTTTFTIGMLLLLYSIFSIALLSDLMKNLFLEPIKVFMKLVNYVQRGKFDVRALVNTENEIKNLADSFNEMTNSLAQREKMRRFVSDKLFESLDNSQAKEQGLTKVAILFSDIRNFTSISETHEPEEIVNLLNEYFTQMESAITEHGGSIEKIIGDAIVAAFYENSNLTESLAIRACKGALEMKEKLKVLNAERNLENKFSIETGIGVALGEVLLGFAGKKARRKEFLLIGEVVKKAEELETETKQGISSKIFIDLDIIPEIKEIIPIVEAHQNKHYRELL